MVERYSSYIVNWYVGQQRHGELLQQWVDASPQASFYYSDLYAPYREVVYYPGIHTPMPNKSQTYPVEGMNAELRHYLARLARRSRCFSRCEQALTQAVKLFVFAWNRRQVHRQKFPDYTFHLMDFVCP